MTAARRVEHRCRCGKLLAVQTDGAVHLKYKLLTVTLRGRVEIGCRRCGRTVTLSTSL